MTESFEHVNHLVLNFYADGYSIAVKLNEFPVFTSETILETAKISYEETSLLDYIENEELPPLLVEMIDSSPKLSQYKLWQNGCLILEVRDKINLEQHETIRRINTINFTAQNSAKEHLSTQQNHSTPHSNAQLLLDNLTSNDCGADCIENLEIDTSTKSSSIATTSSNSYFILLKPTNLSMLNDVLNLTESNIWSAQDKLQLESQIVLHNSPPLFLEPDANKQHLTEQKELLVNEKINNIYTRHKKKFPHTKLRSIYPSKTEAVLQQGYSTHKSLYGSNSSNNNSDRNIYQTTPESLPPELVLQQFLVEERAKKKSFPVGHMARFHRYKKHSSSHFK